MRISTTIPPHPFFGNGRRRIIGLLCGLWIPIGGLSMVACLGQEATELPVNPKHDPKFEIADDVGDILIPIFSEIAKADVSRVKIELSVETVLHGEIARSETSTFQIASKHPNRYTIYHKSDEDRLRIFSDGELCTVALSPEAYYELPDVLDCQSIVNSAPVALGPYPEPMLALSLAGVDPAYSFLSGMNSVTMIGKDSFRGQTESIHLRGLQDDGVTWDFWVTDPPPRRPLRLLVNLTPMLVATGQVRVPEGYELSLRYDFVTWRMSGEVEDSLFRFTATDNAIEYDSLADYQKQMEQRVGDHPLLGKPVPDYQLTLMDGSTVTSDELKGKIVVLDFWATWCTPCLEAMPLIAKSVKGYSVDEVVFIAVNVGENPNLVKGFAGEQDWGVDVAVDPAGDLIETFAAKKIPLTLLIGRDGVVEAAHVGYSGPEALASRFKDELDVLTAGGRIASSTSESE